MPVKPRESTTKIRAKGSKISPPRHVLAPGLHCAEFACKCLSDENKHVLGVITFCSADIILYIYIIYTNFLLSACVSEREALWMLICSSPVGYPLALMLQAIQAV